MTQQQATPEHDNDCDGLDYPTGRPIILASADYHKGLIRGFQLALLAKEQIRRKFWTGWLCGTAATCCAMLTAGYWLG